ncbi:hypothetical protein GCM10029964_024000 [Kibdelosporangium lantanae]
MRRLCGRGGVCRRPGWPAREGRAVGLGWVGGGQDDRADWFRVSAGRTGHRAQPVDGSAGGELGRSQSFHHVATDNLAGLLHCPQHAVHPAEAAGDAFGVQRASGEDTVSF